MLRIQLAVLLHLAVMRGSIQILIDLLYIDVHALHACGHEVLSGRVLGAPQKLENSRQLCEAL